MDNKIKALVNIYIKLFKVIHRPILNKVFCFIFLDIILIFVDVFIYMQIANSGNLGKAIFGENRMFYYLFLLLLFVVKNIGQISIIYFKNKLAFVLKENITMRLFENVVFFNFKTSGKADEKDSSLVLIEPLNFILNIFLPTWTLFSDIITLVIFLFAFLSVNLYATLILLFTFGIPIFIVEYLFNKKISANGIIRQDSEIRKFRIFKSLISASDDISIMKIQNYFRSKFRFEEKRHSSSIAFKAFKNESVKNITELIMIISLVILYITNFYFFKNNFVVLLASLSFIGYRAIPVLNRSIVSMQSINHGKAAFFRIIDFIQTSKTLPTYNPPLTSKKDVIEIGLLFNNFSLLNSKLLFKSKEIFLKRGEVLVIHGKSGSGKSTILSSIINGKKDQLSIYVDDKIHNDLKSATYLEIGSLSQTPFVFPSSIIENIIVSIEHEKISSFDANYYQVLFDDDCNSELSINKLFENGLVSEDTLSGGQKQRIGLLRALYHGKDILILDEPTSALDIENKKNFLKILTMIAPRLFIIIVSHDQEIIDLANKNLNLNDYGY